MNIFMGVGVEVIKLQLKQNMTQIAHIKSFILCSMCNDGITVVGGVYEKY